MEQTKDKIQSLREELEAVILAHNYQIPEIQEVADFVGDSLELSVKASKVDQDVILFCGVTFMAETAKILCSQKKVIIPRREARCPMADMASAEAIKTARQEHPDAAVVSYVNTNAEVKAVSDVCCTSSNAIKVVESLDEQEIIFVPDINLARYVQRHTTKKIIPWQGFCYVHARFLPSEVKKAKQLHPDALLLVHPECPEEVIDLADEVLSTGGMVRFARESSATEFLIATEEGLLHRLARENPRKRFMAAGVPRICSSMKRIGMDDVVKALLTQRYEVEVPERVRRGAEQALRRMIDVS